VCTGRAHLAPEGSTLCEEGVPTTEANCLAAVKSLVTFTASSRTALVGPEGSTACESGWGTVPIGCSSQTGGDQAAYFRDSLGGGGELDPRCISKIYQPVCMEGDVSGVKSTWVQDDVTSCGRLIYRGHDDQATCQRLCEENDGCHGFTTYYPSCGGKCYHWDAKCTTTSPRTGCWRSTVSSYAVERTALCDESMTGTHGDGYRGCQSKTTTGVACAKWAGQILKTDGTSCASSGLADLSYDDCWALRWKQPDGWIPDAKGNKLDSRYMRYFSAHWRNLPYGCQIFFYPPNPVWSRVVFNLANKGGTDDNKEGETSPICPNGWCVKSYSLMVCGSASPLDPAKGLGEHNYCRNPTADPGGIWCYTDAMNTKKEACAPSLLTGSIAGGKG